MELTPTKRSLEFIESSPYRNQCDNMHNSIRYSFPKLKRFEKSNVLQIFNNRCDKLYEKSSTLSQRATGIGYGKKVEIGLNILSPGPGQYSVQKTLQKNHPIAIGLGRDNVVFNHYVPKNTHLSSPGEQGPKSFLNKISYSMRKKLNALSKDDVPGPGKYDFNCTLTPNGKYLLSKNKNEEKYKTPGIGEYDTNVEKKKGKGLYLLSTLRSVQAKSIGNEKRQTFEDTQKTPGPGSYNIYSQFR